MRPMDLLRKLLFLPPGGSDMADSVDRLHFLVIGFTFVGSIVVAAFLIFFLVKYRRTGQPERTRIVKPSTALEVSVWGGLLSLFVVFWVLGYRQYLDMRENPEGARDVYVTGQQWVWKFAYPEGRTTAGYLVVPQGQPVKLIITSRDVVHSFYVPAFRLKQDAVPGRYTSMWFEARSVGTFPVFCAEYCGASHSRMRADVVVLDQQDYARWLEGYVPRSIERVAAVVPEAERNAAVRNMADRGREIAVHFACLSCHSTDGKPSIGPTLKGLFGKRVSLTSGAVVLVDEDYLTRSLMEPNAEVAAGFSPVMPTYQGTLSSPDVAALLAFIKSLHEVAHE